MVCNLRDLPQSTLVRNKKSLDLWQVFTGQQICVKVLCGRVRRNLQSEDSSSAFRVMINEWCGARMKYTKLLPNHFNPVIGPADAVPSRVMADSF